MSDKSSAPETQAEPFPSEPGGFSGALWGPQPSEHAVVIVKDGHEVVNEAQRDVWQTMRTLVAEAEEDPLPSDWPELMTAFMTRVEAMTWALAKAIAVASEHDRMETVKHWIRVLDDAVEEIESEIYVEPGPR